MISRIVREFSKLSLPSEKTDLAALMFTLYENKAGSLSQALQIFVENNLNLTHIESRPADNLDLEKGYTFIVDVESPEPKALSLAMQKLKDFCENVMILGSLDVPWFPRKTEELDKLPQVLGRLPDDHPGATDADYQEKRLTLQLQAMEVKSSSPLPLFEYTAQENKTWKTLYVALSPLWVQVACHEFTVNFSEMRDNGLIREDSVPQVRELSNYLSSKTGFSLKPIGGLASQRSFLSCLAFRVFPTTVHMRHHSNPYFSMDPDVAHEAIGHVALLANPEFAEFVQEIGLTSLGATDEDVQKLMNLYFYSIEHGLMLSNLGRRFVYGARILSSVDEIYHALSIRPELRHFDPFQACKSNYSRKSLQSVYWFSSDFREAKSRMQRFAASLNRPFHATFDRKRSSIRVDHKIRRVN